MLGPVHIHTFEAEPTMHCARWQDNIAAMANAFGLVLDSASVRRAAVEVVPETVIAAIYLLHENNVDAVASRLKPDELLHVIRLVGRCPSCYPPGTLDALKRQRLTPAP